MHGGLAPKCRMHGNDPFSLLIKMWMLAVAFLFSHASNECSVVCWRVNTFAHTTEDILVSANSLPTPCIMEQREYFYGHTTNSASWTQRGIPLRGAMNLTFMKRWTTNHEPRTMNLENHCSAKNCNLGLHFLIWLYNRCYPLVIECWSYGK